MRLRALIILSAVALMLGACDFFKYPRNGIYLIPKGFTGAVIILFERPDGVELLVEDGLYVYRIPNDGLLKVKGKGYTGMVNLSYYYVDDEGRREQLKYLRITGENDINGQPKDKFDGQINKAEYESGIFVTNTGGIGTTIGRKGNFSYTSFIVGAPKDIDRHYSEKENRLFALQREAIEKGLH